MKRVALGLALVVAIAAAASLGAYALTGSDNGAKGAGEGTPTRPTGMTKCRPDAPDCEQQARENGGNGPDPASGGGITATCLPGTGDCNDTPDTAVDNGGAGASPGAAGSCLAGTDCNDTPEPAPTPDGTAPTPSPSTGTCAKDNDCNDTAVSQTSTGETP